ncbi:FAD:protein FMN transferase [Paludisphaera mucosa]|uniref:FAD:protein FMN transferase n=1 Tax=Paludisphaera mucosa TaxID=3030827 RepID=A0ABT6F8R3_9BACT|nr:FAD:protein FMN transferase [Paludisphaera mucosa]MDG3003976.1 FAD:protein FMN transferase [Paludisphaera mucosa]
MGSSFKILLYSTDETAARRASRAAFDRIARLDAVLSDYDVDSELSRLSAASGGPPVAVGPELFDVLERSRYWYDRTEGRLDPTIAPVGRLWRRARRERKLPEPDKLAEALPLVGMDKLVLDPAARTVRLTKSGMKLDVGGIAKGYASQAAIDVLRAQGIDRALVAGAGDIAVSGPPPDAPGWTIGVATLEPSKTEPEIYLSLKAQAVSTSGDAERFVVIDGRRYSHIIDPKTGRAIEDRASVTVVAPDGATADALETTAYMLGPEKGLALIDSVPGAAGVFTRETPEGLRRYESSRFKDVPRARPRPAP